MNTTEKYTQVYGSPFLTGVFMGVNAIKDAALYVDGPDCIFYKADLIYKTHDLYSGLKDSSIDTKLYFSGVMPNKMVRGYDDKIKKKMSYIEDNPKFNLGVVTCMPVTGLLATQYSGIYSDFSKDFIFVPSSTDKFWTDGYSGLLKELSKKVSLDTTKEKLKRHISIIGFLFDRNEGDVLGNINEIKRCLNLIGVEIDCIWLSGDNYSDLSKVENSELLISFPYGKQAANVLSKRLSIDVLDADIPFGISATIHLLESIGKKLGIEADTIKEMISKEVFFIKDKIDLLEDSLFVNKRYIYAGDPSLEGGMKDIGEFLGFVHSKSYFYQGDSFPKGSEFDSLKIDLVIGNSEFFAGYDNIETPLKFEFGFPSYSKHYLLDRPYMGFRGFLSFVEELYTLLLKKRG